MSFHFEFRHTKTICENYLKLSSAQIQIRHSRQDEFHFRTDVEAMIIVSSFLLKQEKRVAKLKTDLGQCKNRTELTHV